MLAEYRVIEVFPDFIITIGGSVLSILLPKTSRALQKNDIGTINKIAYDGTRYTSILVAILCFPVMLNASDLLKLYVGENYCHLYVWLFLWVFTISLSLHNTPISSLVLSTGKTRMLIYSSAFSCIISIAANAILTRHYGVGSAVIGYLIYIIIQLLFYYLYFNSNVLGLVSLKVFKSFIIPTALAWVGILFVLPISILKLPLGLNLIVKSVLWVLAYFSLLVLTRQININKIRNVLASKRIGIAKSSCN
jgi:O-antigen/teichoic acid export membrane protein